MSQVFKSPESQANSLIQEELENEFVKYFKDADIGITKDVTYGSTYLDENGYFTHNRGSHGEAEDRIIQKYKENPDLIKKLNGWITNNTITLNSKPAERYMLLHKEPNEKQYAQLTSWLDKFYPQLYSIEVNYQDTPIGKHLGHKTYWSNESTVDDIINDIRKFYLSRKNNGN